MYSQNAFTLYSNRNILIDHTIVLFTLTNIFIMNENCNRFVFLFIRLVPFAGFLIIAIDETLFSLKLQFQNLKMALTRPMQI